MERVVQDVKRIEKQKRVHRSRLIVVILLVTLLVGGSITQGQLVEAKAAHVHTDDCYVGEKHVHDAECGGTETKYGCNMCNYTGKLTTGHVPSWTQVWGTNIGDCPRCREPNAFNVAEYECWCGNSGMRNFCWACGYAVDRRPSFCYDNCTWCHDPRYRTLCSDCNGTEWIKLARCNSCGATSPRTQLQCSYCGSYDMDREYNGSLQCSNCARGTVFIGSIQRCDAGCMLHVHTSECAAEPGYFCLIPDSPYYYGGTRDSSAPAKSCRSCNSDMYYVVSDATVYAYCSGCADTMYDEYGVGYSGVAVDVKADIYSCQNYNCSESGRRQVFVKETDMNYGKVHEGCTKPQTECRKGETNGYYEDENGNYIAYPLQYFISHEPDYKGQSGYCTTCNGRGYRLCPPCTKEEGKYYDASGNEVGPICNQVVTALEPMEPVQKISAGQTPNVQAVATFRDGTSKTVTCSYTGFSATTYNTEQTVTLSYGTYHDSAKTPGAKKCTIKVTVQGYFALTVSSSQPGMGSAMGGGTKLAGSAVTVNATPSGSNRFTGWYEGATLVSTQASYRFTMPARNVVLVAHFIRIPVSLTVVPDKNMVYNGSEPSYAVTVKYSDGSSVVLTPLQYTKNGFTKGTGIKTVSFSYTESGVTVTTAISVTVIRNTRTCKHGHIYELSDKDTDEGCSKCATTLDSISAYPSEQAVSPGGTPNFLVTGTYLDGHSVALYGWTTNFNSSGLGVQYVTITYGGQTCQAVVKVVKTFTCGVCGTVYEANEDLSNPGCPECRRSCVSIAVSPATQMVEQGSPISITVTARFRDGHTEEVTDWSSNYRPYTLGKQQVAVLYGGQTASVQVEVVAKKAVCINCGTAYDPMQGWCPNCGHILSAIRASTIDGSNLVITGIRPEFKVYGIYLDGHEERIEGGYTYSGLDIYTAGVQNVTVKYGGFFCTVTVTVLDGAGYNMCEKGHVYQLNSDGSDSGCPYCSIDEDDKTEMFYTTSYTDEIIGQMYRDGVYYLKDGDAVTITVKRQEKSGIAKLFDWIFRRFRDGLSIKAGGIVGE